MLFKSSQFKTCLLVSHTELAILPRAWNHCDQNIFYFEDHFQLLQGNCLDLLPHLRRNFDMVFADPPYFLSNDGQTFAGGKIVSVNKGDWDCSPGLQSMNDFNRQWLGLVREKMKDGATIWICGTHHNIFSIGQVLAELDFKILNMVTWQKKNPPPNFACRTFTHSTEFIIWARKSVKVPHYFDYALMKQLNGDKQMKDVWPLASVARWEQTAGKHPTQKPLSLLSRIIVATTQPQAWILDPFAGSSSTGIAAQLFKRNFVGIEQDAHYLELGKRRRWEIEVPAIRANFLNKIGRQNDWTISDQEHFK
jgi:site-specific DNA-methyltransferase (adenine-specific)